MRRLYLKKYSAVLLFLSFTALCFGQKFELNEVTKQELEERSCSVDSSASAAYLFTTCALRFDYSAENGFSYIAEYKQKIKIYKTEGLRWADVKIPFYVGYKKLNKDRIVNLKAYSYNLEEGKVKKQKVTSSGVLLEKTNEFWETKLITFPGVKPGSIIELTYEIRSEDIQTIDLFQYQFDIPVRKAYLKMELPLLYTYKIIRSGFVDIPMQSNYGDGSINYSAYIEGTRAKRDYILNFKTAVYELEQWDVPALKNEPFTANRNDYYAKISLELESVQFPDEPQKKIAVTWDDVVKTVFSNPSFGGELQKTSYFLSDLDRIVQKEMDTRTTTLAIFEWVKKQIAWNGKMGYNTSQSLEEAYNKRNGNVADVNLILTAMLTQAGIDAHPVLLSTRENGFVSFPSYSKFNYVITAVNLDGEQLLLDATQKAGKTTLLPVHALNEKGRLIRKNGTSEEVSLTPKTPSISFYNIQVNWQEDKGLIGDCVAQFTNYDCWDVMADSQRMDKDTWIRNRENKFKNIVINKHDIQNKSEEAVAKEIFSFETDKFVEKIGEKWYVDPLLFNTHTIPWFTAENRQYPVNFTYPKREMTTVIFSYPAEFQLESAPVDKVFKMSNDTGSFRFFIERKPNQLVITTTLSLNKSEIPAEQYLELKEFFTLVVAKETEKIVLVKK